MHTKRLYWDDSLRLEVTLEVAETVAVDGTTALVFPATIAYPEAGGQLPDRGTVTWDGGTASLRDVRDEDGGKVLHLLDLPPGVAPPAPGTRVQLRIDEATRRDHMSQHTGQHLLSRALLDVAGAETVSSHLGAELCTVDLKIPALADRAVEEAELLVARVVLEDRPVRAFFPTPEELARLPLRREPKVQEEVRIIEVEGFDLSPCGGTHCHRTGQVGPVHVVGVERHKGGVRVHFHAGLRAVRDYRTKDRIVAGLARDFTCGVADVPAAVEKLRNELRERSREAGALRERLAGLRAESLLAGAAPLNGVRVVATVLPGEPVEAARALAARVAAEPDAVALVAAAGADAVRLVVQRGEAVEQFDAGAALKRIAAACGGRGGGRPDRAEGQVPAGAPVAEAFEAERRRLAGAGA
jgi:alanyl-tRNA synthetase